jgi:hypothetical protein
MHGTGSRLVKLRGGYIHITVYMWPINQFTNPYPIDSHTHTRKNMFLSDCTVTVRS